MSTGLIGEAVIIYEALIKQYIILLQWSSSPVGSIRILGESDTAGQTGDKPDIVL